MFRSEKTKHSPAHSDNPDLRLSGSQINLVNRRDERSVSRATIVTSPHVFRRPMSAMPELSAYKSRELNQTKPISWLRPQSADNAVINNTKRSKLAARFNLHETTQRNSTLTSSSSSLDEPQQTPIPKQIALRSSQLLETLLSEPVMRSWAHTEVRTMTSNNTTSDDISEDIDSIKSDEPMDSEISFGTKIQNLAQRNQTTMELKPGVKHKPPLPSNKRTEDIKLNSPKKVMPNLNESFSSDESESTEETLHYSSNIMKNTDRNAQEETNLLSQSTLSLAVSMSEDYRKKLYKSDASLALKALSSETYKPAQINLSKDSQKIEMDLWSNSNKITPTYTSQRDASYQNSNIFEIRAPLSPTKRRLFEGENDFKKQNDEPVEKSKYFSSITDDKFDKDLTYLHTGTDKTYSKDLSSTSTELSFQGWLMDNGHSLPSKIDLEDTERQTNLLLEKVRSHQTNLEDSLAQVDDYKLNRGLPWESVTPIEEESESLVAYEENNPNENEKYEGIIDNNTNIHKSIGYSIDKCDTHHNISNNDAVVIRSMQANSEKTLNSSDNEENSKCNNLTRDVETVEDQHYEIPILNLNSEEPLNLTSPKFSIEAIVVKKSEVNDEDDQSKTNDSTEIIITTEDPPSVLTNNNILFSLDEYDAKLKEDTEFLSLELSREEQETEVNFISLDGQLAEKTDNCPNKNTQKSKRTGAKSTPYENKNKTKVSTQGMNKQTSKNAIKICKKIEPRLPSPELKTSPEVTSWMSERNTDFASIFEKPERDGSTNYKIKKEIQQVLSTIPSTYDDIVSILKVLEHNSPNETPKCQFKTYTPIETEPPQKKDSADKIVENLNEILEKENHIELSSSSNYNEILSYLDEVDRSCAKTLNTAVLRAQSVKETTDKTLNGSFPTMDGLTSMSTLDLAHIILDMHLQLEEKKSSVHLLQDTLTEQRAISQKSAKQTEIEYKKKAKLHKEEFEAVVKRHQKFIDQLIADKKTLSERCESLVKEMRQQDDRHTSAIKAADHRHTVELQRAKEMQAAGEKIRREKWLAGKTEKIKEMTVKGLEPELHSMQIRHQQETTEIRALHKQEIEELELRAARKTQQQCESLRDQLTAEKEQAITKEREHMRERLEKLVETEEMNYQEQRRRLASEAARTKQRLEDEHAARVAECESREEAAARERDRVLETNRTEYEERFQVIARRHSNELKAFKEAVELDRESWQSNFKKEQAVWLSNKEAELREQCRKERDREIELVIDRLENDSNELKKQLEQAADNRVRRLTEKYNTELRELEDSEKATQQRYLEMKTKLIENEDTIVDLRNKIKRLKTHLGEAEETTQKLMSERSNVKELVKEELRGEVTKLEKEVQALREERDREMQQVYTRVKVAVARKDETLATLTRERASLQERCQYLEQLLEQQRREYLIK